MLELQNLSLSLEGENESVEILKNINLVLEDHKFYVITGPNGGGKSSLAKVIMGIYRPTAGRILLNGQDITELSISERARLGIGYAFQQPPRFKGITVSDLLKLSRDRVQPGTGCNFLYDVGLCPKDYVQREINASLSGGELKRIEIATLLNRNLQVAVFDEPEAGIDLWSFSKLTETFRKLHSKYNSITVIISHQERILNLADEIVLLANGEIEAKGEKEKVLPLILNECDCKKECLERGESTNECY